jgi:hypothetical protein
MPNIPIEIFSTFFGDASEDAEKHLINFKGTCYDFNLTEDNVTCRLFLQTLREDALEWYSSLMPNSITSWDVLEDSFAEKFIPKVHSYVFVDVLNVVSHPSSPIWKQDNKVTNFKEESNQRVDEISKSSHVAEKEDENSKLQEENFSLLYTPYEDISSNKFENEIEEPPPNTQEDFSLVIDDETSQENLQQEELMEEMNLEKNDEQDHLYKKEEYFQEIFDESRTLEVVVNKEKDECILMSKTPQPRIDFIELWFQSIVGQTTQSNLHHTWYNFSPVHIESAPDSLVQVPTYLRILEFIPQIRSMLEWLHWKSAYT